MSKSDASKNELKGEMRYLSLWSLFQLLQAKVKYAIIKKGAISSGDTF